MRAEKDTRRRSHRHHAEIPIEYSIPDSNLVKQTRSTHNISKDGLSFASNSALPINLIIDLTIRITQPHFEERAKVVWCKLFNGEYEIGVKFLSEEAIYRIKMVEQACHIEQYRKNMKIMHGRDLSVEEAAMEWISKFAADYRRRSH
jgi:hypothetical protein